ncbi:tryptophan synthase subunit alpha [Streptomyces noursei]|uniref:tryptophan synthase subunit alpha n=1 Tax=Streptomyces noursei TaxID=1971 RepID=UPI0038304268
MTYGVDARDTASQAGSCQNTGLMTDQLEGPRPVLGAFWVAGFPDSCSGVEALVAYAESGAAVLEVGAPAMNPWLDGRAIAAAHHCAIRAGHGVETTLATVQQVSALTGKPVIVMSYWATIESYGVGRVTHALASAGAAGCLVPDVPAGQVGAWAAAAAAAGISAPLLANREASPGELTATSRAATGFVYAPAVAGQRTGYADGIDLDSLASFVASVRRAAPVTPVVTGIGISTPDLAAAVVRQTGVVGVMVGSPLIRAFAEGGLSRAAGLASEFTAAVARPRVVKR